jgi:hypothetical protein
VPLTDEQRYENIAIQFPTLAQSCYREIARTRQAHATATTTTAVGCIEEEFDMEQVIAAAIEVVKVRVAMGSAATDNVINPDELPEDALQHIIPNTSGKHFVGANNAHIEKYGQVDTLMESNGTKVSCAWQASDVNRALHSVAKVCGPKGAGNAKQDVLFDNDVCVVVPPGIVKEILKRLKPILQYEREGNLYIADVEMSSFHRQGQHA